MTLVANISLILDRLNWVLIGFGGAVVLWLLVELIAKGPKSPLLAFAPLRLSVIPAEFALLPVVVVLVVPAVVAQTLSSWFGGVDLSDTANADTLGVMAIAQNAGTLCALVAAYMVGARFVSRPGAGFVVGERKIAGDVFAGLLAALAALAVCQGVLFGTQTLIVYFDAEYVFPVHPVIELMTSADQPRWIAWLMWVGAGVITPIAEELFFRGILQTMLQRLSRSRWTGIIAAGLLFGLAHADLPQVIPALTVFGIILGILYENRGSLIAPIIAHALFNAKTLLWLTLAT